MKNQGFTGTCIQSMQMPWVVNNLSAPITTAAESALAVTDKSYAIASAVVTDTVSVIKLPKNINVAMLSFALQAAADTVSFDVYACALGNDADAVLHRVCTVAVVAGTVHGTGDNTNYHIADSITVTNDNWASDITACVPGDNEFAFLLFDSLGFDTLLLHCTAISSDNVLVFYRGV